MRVAGHERSVAEEADTVSAVTAVGLDDLRAELGADPRHTALLFDFDGTLAPIVDDPAAARPVAGAIELLEALVPRFGRVAVVSGRPRSFLVEHVGPAVDLSGLYGLETRVGGKLADHAEADVWRDVVASVVAEQGRGLPDGVTLEPKGLSITVHYRRAPDAAGAVSAWADDVAARTGLDVRPAKQSVELHPPVSVDKGTSVEAFAEGCTAVAYLGDDVGDLPAFAALDRLRAAGRRTWKIAVASAELPEAIAEQADAIVDGPDGVLELLRPLAAASV